MGKHNHSKVTSSFAFFFPFFICVEKKSMQFPKHGMNEIRCYGKSLGKYKDSKVMGSLHISRKAEIQYNFHTSG